MRVSAGAEEYYGPQPGDNGEYENTFLNWLLPSSMRQTIGAMGATPTELSGNYYEQLRKEAEELFSEGWINENDERVVALKQKIADAGLTQFLDTPSSLESMGMYPSSTFFELPSFSDLTEQQQADIGALAENREGSIPEYSADIDPFSSQSILENISGLGPAYKAGKYPELKPEMVQPLKPSGLRPLHTGFYTDWLSGKKSPLISSLTEEKEKAQSAGGGFAGYGGRKELATKAESSYLDRLMGLYGDIDRYKLGATQDVMGQIQSWTDIVPSDDESGVF